MNVQDIVDGQSVGKERPFSTNKFWLKWVGLNCLAVVLFLGLLLQLWGYAYFGVGKKNELVLRSLLFLLPFILVIAGRSYLLRPLLPKASNWFWASLLGWVGGSLFGTLAAWGLVRIIFDSVVKPSISSDSLLFIVPVIGLSFILLKLFTALLQYLVLQPLVLEARRWVTINLAISVIVTPFLLWSFFSLARESYIYYFWLLLLVPNLLAAGSGWLLSHILDLPNLTQIRQRVETYVS